MRHRRTVRNCWSLAFAASLIGNLFPVMGLADDAPPRPDMSAVPPKVSVEMESACTDAYYVSMKQYHECLKKQVDAYLARNPKKASKAKQYSAGDMSALPMEISENIKAACASSYYAGPAAYRDCVSSHMHSYEESIGTPDLSPLPPLIRKNIKAACASDYYIGPVPYHQCLRSHAFSVGYELNGKSDSAASAGKSREVGKSTNAKAKSAASAAINQPMPRSDELKQAWPLWIGQRPPMPLAAQSQEIPVAELYKSISRSVYILVGAKSLQDLSSGKISQGSAVAISKHEALTNCHIVQGNSVLKLFSDTSRSSTIDARLLYAHPQTDRCIIRATFEMVPISSLKRSADVVIGERVYTIGNPSGLANTLGDGLISGIRKKDGVVLMQTSAPISPGSSGGALIDARGALIGITSFRLKDAQNLNFAVSADEFWNEN